MYHKIIEEQMEALQGYINSAVKTANEEAEIDEGGEEEEPNIRDKEIEADSVRDAIEDTK